MDIQSEPGAGQLNRRFIQLYMTVQRRLHGYVIALIPDFTAVDDILQETVMVMWREFDTFGPGTDFAAWAMAIARNQVFKHIKSRKKHQRCLSLETVQALAKTAETPAKGQDDRLEALRHCIKKLSNKDTQLLALRYEVGATLKSVPASTYRKMLCPRPP